MSPKALEKINVKLFADVPHEFDYDVLLTIFGRWRLETGEEIMDLADYAHVDHGPNCLLVSHKWHFGIDLGDGKPSFFISVRKGLTGTPADRISQALQLLLEKTARLLGEAECPKSLHARCGELEIVLNDRLIAPNVEGTASSWRPALDSVLLKLYGASGAVVEAEKDKTRRVGWKIRSGAGAALTPAELLSRLG